MTPLGAHLTLHGGHPKRSVVQGVYNNETFRRGGHPSRMRRKESLSELLHRCRERPLQRYVIADVRMHFAYQTLLVQVSRGIDGCLGSGELLQLFLLAYFAYNPLAPCVLCGSRPPHV